MAAQNYRVAPALGSSPLLAAQLLNLIENLNQTYAQLLTIRAAMIQEKDGSAGNATDWVTPSKVFGFVLPDGVTVSSSVALAAFTELDSFVTAAGPSLTQMCARFKQ